MGGKFVNLDVSAYKKKAFDVPSDEENYKKLTDVEPKVSHSPMSGSYFN